MSHRAPQGDCNTTDRAWGRRDQLATAIGRVLALLAAGSAGIVSAQSLPPGPFPPPPQGPILVTGVPTLEGDDGTRPMRFFVGLVPSNTAPASITLRYRTEDATATAGEDYSATEGELTLTRELPVGFVDVPIRGDTAVEPTESLELRVRNADDTIRAGGKGYIINDDGIEPPPPRPDQPVVIALDGHVREPDTGEVDGSITLMRLGPNDTPLSVDFEVHEASIALVGGPALATRGSDYTGPTTGTIDFAPGERLEKLTFKVLADDATEPVEIIPVKFMVPDGVKLPREIARLRIIDDDRPDPGPRPVAAGVIACRPVVLESSGEAKLLVRRFGNVAPPLAVSYETVDDSAKAGEDYTASRATIEWAAGESDPRIVTVPVLPDDVVERPEKFWVRLESQRPNVVLAPPRAPIVILDGRDDVFTDDFAEICDDEEPEQD